MGKDVILTRLNSTPDSPAPPSFAQPGSPMSNASSSQAPPDAALTLAEALAALHVSEERFRAFITAGTDVVYRMNADWSEVYQLVGRDFIADAPKPTKNWLDEYIYPEDHTRVLATIGEAIRTRGVFERGGGGTFVPKVTLKLDPCPRIINGRLGRPPAPAESAH